MKILDYLPDLSPQTVRTGLLIGGVLLAANYFAIPAIDRLRDRRAQTRLTTGT